ncbi:MAG: hypothetical protein COC21_01365 [Verrucomicrobiales bacterium]|jgi:hypothetical protein|nr:MAG: hypothetical protein COC21_01365 [Verrucomicrobiales bacterium]
MKTASKEGETVYLEEEGLLVTNKRIVIIEKTYAVKQITALGASVYKDGPKTIFGINIGKSAAWCWLGWIVVEFLLMELTATYVISSIMFLLFIGALFLSLLWAFWPSDIRYWVKIGSASGEEKALLCNTKDEAQTISEAINDALFDNFALKNKFNRSSWC